MCSVGTDRLGFRCRAFYIGAEVLAWKTFWTMADERQHNWGSVFLAWTAVGIAVWVGLSI